MRRRIRCFQPALEPVFDSASGREPRFSGTGFGPFPLLPTDLEQWGGMWNRSGTRPAGRCPLGGIRPDLVSETENVDRTQKEKQVAELRDIFSDAELVIVTHQSGMTVAETSTLAHGDA